MKIKFEREDLKTVAEFANYLAWGMLGGLGGGILASTYLKLDMPKALAYVGGLLPGLGLSLIGATKTEPYIGELIDGYGAMYDGTKAMIRARKAGVRHE